MHLFCFCVWFFFIYISYLFFVIFLKLYVGAVTSFVDFFPCLVIAHVLNPWRIWIQKEAYLNQRNAKQYVFVRVQSGLHRRKCCDYLQIHKMFWRNIWICHFFSVYIHTYKNTVTMMVVVAMFISSCDGWMNEWMDGVYRDAFNMNRHTYVFVHVWLYVLTARIQSSLWNGCCARSKSLLSMFVYMYNEAYVWVCVYWNVCENVLKNWNEVWERA